MRSWLSMQISLLLISFTWNREPDVSWLKKPGWQKMTDNQSWNKLSDKNDENPQHPLLYRTK